MSNLLQDKICLVTGATRGIGKVICELFAREGATVYANEREEGIISKWLYKQEDIRNKIIPICFDVTDANSIKNAIMLIKKQQGRVDVLVNNAGVEYNEYIGMITEEHLRHMLNVNVCGVINMVQYGSKIMSKSENASIINIASIVGVYGNPGQSAYSATKGAVISFTKSAAKELGTRGIRVNAIAPGLTNTEMMQSVERDKIQKRIDNISLGRIAEPLDIANACVYLASDYSKYITGQILGVDGGSVL